MSVRQYVGDTLPLAQQGLRLLHSTQVGPTKDITLDEKLRALDALYEQQFAEKGKKHEKGLEVATFRRK